MNKPLLLYLMAILIFVACVKPELPNRDKGLIAPFNTTFGLPIAIDTVYMSDLVSSASPGFSISIGTDGVYSFDFGPDTFDFPTAEEFIKLPNQTVSPLLSIPASALNVVSNTQLVITLSGLSSYDYLEGSELNTIYFKDGSLQVGFKNELVGSSSVFPANVFLTFVNITNASNQPLRIGTSIDEYRVRSGDPVTFSDLSKYGSLRGYKMTFTEPGNYTLTCNISFSNPSASDGTFSGFTGNMIFDRMTLSGLKWSALRGKFGSLNLPLVNEASIPVTNGVLIQPFKNNISSDTSFYFENPSMTIDFFSNYGIRSKIQLNPLRSVSKTGEVLFTADTNDVPPFELPKLLPTGDLATAIYPFQTSRDSVSKPVLRNLMLRGPKEIVYGLYLKTDIDRASASDFMTDDSRIRAITNIKLPLYGYVQLFNVYNEIDFPPGFDGNITNGNDTPIKPNFATLRLDYLNGLPLDVFVQVYFLDAVGRRIDSLVNRKDYDTTTISKFIGKRIKAAETDANGNITALSSDLVPFEVFLDENRYAKLVNGSTKIAFLVSANTTNFDGKSNVKIFPKDNIKLRLSARLGANVDLGNSK